MAKPLTRSYACPDGTPFPVIWAEPDQETFGWRWDQMHCPLPVTPLSAEFSSDIMDGFNRAMDVMGSPVFTKRTGANGYLFTTAVPFDDDQSLRTGIRQREEERRVDRVQELWEEQYRPEVEALTSSLRAFDEAGLSLSQLVDRLDRVHAARKRMGELHHYTMGPAGIAANRLIEFCLSEFGQGEQLAAELTQGLWNKSLESALALWDLSRQATQWPDVTGLLRARPPAEVLAALPGVEGGPDFLEQLGAFLDVYGHRSESFTELSFKTWRDEPSFPLFIVRHYLDTPESGSPSALHDATVRRREERTGEIEQRLAGEPAKLETFRHWQRSAQQRTVLLEDHNFYIDQQGFSAARGPCLAIGRRLAEQGTIATADDVFYLHEDEIREASVKPGTRYAGLIETRRAERKRWMGVLPPAVIGDGHVELPPAMARFFGPTRDEPQEPGIIKGIAASAGVVRGVARMVQTLDEVGRLGPGEILVTYATAPPWTPLFAIASAVVTDTGGTLSHCAVVAREYGIPAVVGCKTATQRIVDGTMITVDGTNGVVRIEHSDAK